MTTDRPGDQQLAGYLRAQPGRATTRRRPARAPGPAAARLHGPRLPGRVDAFPLNAQREDRQVRAARARRRPRPAATSVPPRTLIETVLVDSLRRRAGHRAGRRRPTASSTLGGNSLQAMQLISQLRDALGRRPRRGRGVPGPHPAAAGRAYCATSTASTTRTSRPGGSASSTKSAGGPTGGSTMLTDAQRAALAARLRPRPAMTPGGISRRGPRATRAAAVLRPGAAVVPGPVRARAAPTYNIPLALRLRGPLDAAALEPGAGRRWWRGTRRCAPGWWPRRRAAGAGDRPARPRAALELTDLAGCEPETRQARLTRADRTPRRCGRSTWPLGRCCGLAGPAGAARARAADRRPPRGVRRLVGRGALRELAALYRQEAARRAAGPGGTAGAVRRLRAVGAGAAAGRRRWTSWTATGGGRWRASRPCRFPTDRPRPLLDSFDGGLAGRMTGRELLDGLRELSRRRAPRCSSRCWPRCRRCCTATPARTTWSSARSSANRGRAELGPADRVPGQHAADPGRPVRRSARSPNCWRRVQRRHGRRVRAPGPAVRQAGRGAAGGARPEPGAGVPDRADLRRARRRAGAAAGVEFAAHRPGRGINAAKFDLTSAAEARPDGLWLECSYKTALFDAGTIAAAAGALRGAAARGRGRPGGAAV